MHRDRSDCTGVPAVGHSADCTAVVSLCCLAACLSQGLVEEAPREGRGGGFLEREEVVQYKSSRFEDDEDKSVRCSCCCCCCGCCLLGRVGVCSALRVTYAVSDGQCVLMDWAPRGCVLSLADTTTWAA